MWAVAALAVLPRRNVFGIGGLLLAALPVRAAGLPSSGGSYDGDARMRARLAELRASYLDSDLYCGTHEARALRPELAALGPDGQPLALWRVLRPLAFHELRLGDPRQAIVHLERALHDVSPRMKARVPPAQVRQTRFDLGVAWMRLGEVSNCVARHTSRSCSLPIGPEGVHVGRTMPMGANFGDLDQDGWLDVHLGTGFPAYEGLMPNVLWRNDGGRRFLDVTSAAGVGHLQKGHGVAFADFDGDGDTDLFAHMGGAFPGDAFAVALFENPGTGAHFLDVRLAGADKNTFGVGARLTLRARQPDGFLRARHRWVNSGGSFGSNPLTQRIGLGAAQRVHSLEVRWPRGGVQLFEDLSAEVLVCIREGLDEPLFASAR